MSPTKSSLKFKSDPAKTFQKGTSPIKKTTINTSLVGRGVVTPTARISPARKFVGLKAYKNIAGTYLTKKY